ncbi:plasmid pRiA4b ORF-3 family protein [Amycolatopsis sp. BJA-103]|uniref:plasmid pRiA4b ORF-3 family protein n=1 Tax=Amycolatopsis sp. BJA-103 TaxID=1911175 RepID=UPI000CA113EA|nr:plasmid pRiA4b ORF-3 family protein [Amycolatopsis sp. BJA-103]AUI60668.1 hypothetical protein BKN51_22420 [Amycolatopsis sp. BJA-103]PNE22045.1 hypothetical protein B1H26_10075 [Amycolatopsis sp. BJA-103]
MSPTSRGRKPEKPKPADLSDCVARGEPDRDRVTLAATLTVGKRSVSVEVVVDGDRVRRIELHAEPSDALVTEAPLTPEEFRSQVEAALIVRADSDAWLFERVPDFFELGAKSDLPERADRLRRWLGLPEYEPVPRSGVDPLPLVLPPPGPVTGLRLAVALLGPDQAIWRRLEVRSDLTLAGVHRVLAAAFDRDERQYHWFETAYGGFSTDGRYGEGDRLDDQVLLGQVVTAPGHRLVYEAEHWRHWIRVEQVVALPRAPSCLDGERAAPPPECEDEHAYKMLLEALRDPGDEENDGLVEELGGYGFDPEWFDREGVNARLG